MEDTENSQNLQPNSVLVPDMNGGGSVVLGDASSNNGIAVHRNFNMAIMPNSFIHTDGYKMQLNTREYSKTKDSWKAYFRCIFNRRCNCKAMETKNFQEWDKYWRYFVKEWTERTEAFDWNYNSFLAAASSSSSSSSTSQPHQSHQFMITTNNAVESHNRTMNGYFKSAHPSMLEFVAAIKQDANSYVLRMNQIQAGRATAPAHQPATLYPIPADYHAFKPPSK